MARISFKLSAVGKYEYIILFIVDDSIKIICIVYVIFCHTLNLKVSIYNNQVIGKLIPNYIVNVGIGKYNKPLKWELESSIFHLSILLYYLLYLSASLFS